MKIQLSDHFTYKRLFRFVWPSIIMMVFISVYGVVDGLFVSNFVGKTAFAAVNLVIPFTMVLGAIGFMLGTGGSALVAKTLGEGDNERANRYFSMLIYTALILGAVIAAAGIAVMDPVVRLMGAEDEQMIANCVTYGRILLLGLPAFMLQNMFQSFLVTAEKPTMGLLVTVSAGVTNMVLDAVLIGLLPYGVAGAAAATAISQCVGGIVPLVFFIRQNGTPLRLGKPSFDGGALLQTCGNGSSELLSNISMSLVSMLYNYQLMKLAGENGVAAYGTIMYVQFVFIAIFIGYAIGTAPIVSYHYGAENHKELKNLLFKSVWLMIGGGVALMLAANLLAAPLSQIFVGYDAELYAMTERGFRVHSFSFLLCGFCIFGSSFFTALNNGPVSAIISFLRTVVFQVSAVLILPVLLGIDGIWLSVSVAELAALLVTVVFLVKLKNRYHYA